MCDELTLLLNFARIRLRVLENLGGVLTPSVEILMTTCSCYEPERSSPHIYVDSPSGPRIRFSHLRNPERLAQKSTYWKLSHLLGCWLYPIAVRDAQVLWTRTCCRQLLLTRGYYLGDSKCIHSFPTESPTELYSSQKIL